MTEKLDEKMVEGWISQIPLRRAGTPQDVANACVFLASKKANYITGQVLQVDGGMKTGLDIIKAAILGAESFGFGTAPLISLGCKYLRICHLNNCATGVATQNNVLRSEYFTGLPEMVINFFRFVAEETRMIMAELGVRKLEDLIGRVELLGLEDGNTARQARLDLSPIVSDAGLAKDAPQYCTDLRNEPFDRGELAEEMLAAALPAIEAKSGGKFGFEVRNFNRSIGARLAGEIARRHGNQGMASAPLEILLRGTAGQSFGVWNVTGLNMTLIGDANDYVGKGMTGGRIVIRPPDAAGYSARETAIIGNTCLYGATGGLLFAAVGTIAGVPSTSVSSRICPSKREPMIDRIVRRSPTAISPLTRSNAIRAERPVPVGDRSTLPGSIVTAFVMVRSPVPGSIVRGPAN